MKPNTRSRWYIIIPILVALLMMFFTKINSVRAVFSDVHVGIILLRVESEIMQKTPAGQYYEALLWKHTGELNQIFDNYPEKVDPALNTIRLFAPALEALVDGKGDDVRITREQVDALKAQLDFYKFVGRPALREDIEREEQQLQLDRFVGVTMNDAWDIINSTWDPDSFEPKLLVPGSDGEWAYFEHKNIYFEYPSNFYAQRSETEIDTIYIVPSSGGSEQWNPCLIKVQILNIPLNQTEGHNPYFWYSQEAIPWESVIENTEFPGIEFAVSQPKWLIMSLHSFQYNEKSQLAVHMWVFVNENPQGEFLDYAGVINQKYGYFQHMVTHLRIWEP